MPSTKRNSKNREDINRTSKKYYNCDNYALYI